MKEGLTMDIQKIINDVIAKLKADDNLLEKFKTNPVKVLEDLIGIDLPDDKINAVIDGIKAKLNLDDIAEKAEGILGALGGLFKK
jgi:hypothetical protein